MCMYNNIYISTYIYIYVYYVYIYINMYIYIYLNMYIYIYKDNYNYIFDDIYIYTHLFIIQDTGMHEHFRVLYMHTLLSRTPRLLGHIDQNKGGLCIHVDLISETRFALVIDF